VGEAALRETLALLDARGYAGLRVADVASKAGIGLGSLYRRWPTKYALVVAALREMSAQRAFDPTDDPEADLLRGLAAIADSLCHRAAPLLSVLLSDPSSELAAAVREAKVEPARAANRDRLRRLLGPVPDLDERADTGPALIIMHLLLNGAPPTGPHIRDHILPVMLAGAGHAGAGAG
jgi:AcrR family transcriptional regulator